MKIGFLVRNTINLLFKSKLDFEFDHVPLTARVTGHKKWNLFKIGLNRLLPVKRVMGAPYMAHISPSGLCDLSCRICPATDPEVRGRQLLSFQTFKKFIDEAGDTLVYVILWSWGEPLLNPELPRMARYAADRNILTVTSTNLNQLSEDQAQKLVRSGLNALIIALDGTSADVYDRQRRGGKFIRVIDNIRLLVAAKKEAGCGPILNLRMVVSRDNEDDVDDFRELAQELGVDMVSFKAFSTRQSGTTDAEFDRQFAPEKQTFRWYEYDRKFNADKRLKPYRCRFPWTKPMMFADGNILFCEFDLHHERLLGNINDQSFDTIWFNQKTHRLRQQFQKDRDSFAFCRNCVFDYRKFDGCVINAEWISEPYRSGC